MINKFENFFLISVALGFSIIGLGYGIDPNYYPSLFGYEVTLTNQKHVFRAFNGLYVSLAVYWLLSLYKISWKKGAVLSIIFVMIGLATGRIISLIIDGQPHNLLIFYLGLELFVLAQGLYIYSKKY